MSIFKIVLSFFFIIIKFQLVKAAGSRKFQEKYINSGGKPVEEKHPPVVGFWNIYAKGTHYRKIIQEQKYMIEASGLIDRVDKIYYATIGPEGESVSFNGSKFEHLVHHGLKSAETKTLHELYKYCHNNERSKVLYFHNKGSYHFTISNTNFRKVLDCFVLNPYCMKALDNHDTCGWRFSPLPHLHYSGNYWWANCKYINRLVDPLSMENNITFRKMTNSLYRKSLPTSKQDTFLGIDRFFGETWIGSYPYYHPADCMNSSVNTRYLLGYALPWGLVQKTCINFHLNFEFNMDDELISSNLPERVKTGFPCDTAAILKDPKKFKNAMENLIYSQGLYRFEREIQKRSEYWYRERNLLQKAILQPFLQPNGTNH